MGLWVGDCPETSGIVVVVVVVVVVVLIQRLRPQGYAREASLSRLPRPGRGSSRLYIISYNSRIF